jgi:hypothetical protein
MASDEVVLRYRRWYRRLLRMYPASHRERFGEAMEQTFVDVIRERAAVGRGIAGSALWMFAETAAAIARERVVSMSGTSARIGRVVMATALLLLVPFVAMQFTAEVNWSMLDFAFMGALLFGTGLAYQLIAWHARSAAYRLAVAVAMAGVFFLVWVNAAVGIIGDPGGVNLMYAGVLLIGIVGAVATRLRAPAMAWPLFAMAAGQMAVPMVALVIAPHEVMFEPPGALGVFVLNACFAAMFVASGMLFRWAGARMDAYRGH